MATETIKSNLKSAIASAQAASSAKAEADFSSTIAKDTVAQARSKIPNAESKLKREEGQLADVNQKLNPPPTKEVDEGGKDGGTKTVVDQDEVAKLNKQKSLHQTNIDAAKREVEEARAAADQASSQALVQMGISADKQLEIDNLNAKADSIASKLSEGGSVTDQEIKELVDGFESTKEGLGENKGGVLSEAFYDPFKAKLENILELIENPPAQGGEEGGGEAAAPPPEGTMDRQLFDIGITDNAKIVEFTTFQEDFAAFSAKVNAGGADVTAEESTAIFNRYDALVAPLSAEQKSSGVITTLDEDVQAIKAAVEGGGPNT